MKDHVSELRCGAANACKTLASGKNAGSATRLIIVSRFELPLLGSNQDSPDPESGVLPVTPRGSTGRALKLARHFTHGNERASRRALCRETRAGCCPEPGQR